MAILPSAVPLALQGLDLLADLARLLLAVPDAAHADLLAVLAVGPQGLAEPALVVGDQARGGGQDMAGGAVVALQPDDPGAGKIALEAQDVAHLGAAPAIDRLVVVADAAEVAPALGQQAQPQILRDVGVLVLVHQDVAELLLVLGQHVGLLRRRASDCAAADRRNRRRSAGAAAPDMARRARSAMPSAKSRLLGRRHLVRA